MLDANDDGVLTPLELDTDAEDDNIATFCYEKAVEDRS
jgi:hypothetical protein